MKKIIPLLLFSFLLAQCKVVKYAPDKLPVNQLVFGNGGGFAGIETSFTVLENGQIFKKSSAEGFYEELAAMKVNEAKDLFARLASMQLYKLDIDKPGNLYYFLREVNQHTDSKINWGAGDYLPPQSLVSFYKDLQMVVKDRPTVKSKTVAVSTEGKKKEEDENSKW